MITPVNMRTSFLGSRRAVISLLSYYFVAVMSDTNLVKNSISVVLVTQNILLYIILCNL